jgi:hypothetical protein
LRHVPAQDVRGRAHDVRLVGAEVGGISVGAVVHGSTPKPHVVGGVLEVEGRDE